MSKVQDLTLDYLAEEVERLKNTRIYELHFKYGYYYCWAIMLFIVIGLVMWFKKKDWF